MSTPRFNPELKEEAVRQIIDSGYPVSEVSERLGVSVPSLPHGQRSRIWCASGLCCLAGNERELRS